MAKSEFLESVSGFFAPAMKRGLDKRNEGLDSVKKGTANVDKNTTKKANTGKANTAFDNNVTKPVIGKKYTLSSDAIARHKAKRAAEAKAYREANK